MLSEEIKVKNSQKSTDKTIVILGGQENGINS